MKNFDRMTVLAGAVVDMVAAAPFACNEEPHYLHDRTAAIEAVAKFLRKKIPGDHKLSPKKADRAYRKVYSVTWGTPAIDCLIGEISAATTSAEIPHRKGFRSGKSAAQIQKARRYLSAGIHQLTTFQTPALSARHAGRRLNLPRNSRKP